MNILSSHSVPGTVLHAEETVVNETCKVIALVEFTVLGGSEAILFISWNVMSM